MTRDRRHCATLCGANAMTIPRYGPECPFLCPARYVDNVEYQWH